MAKTTIESRLIMSEFLDKHTKKTLLELLALVLITIVGTLVHEYISESIGNIFLGIGGLYFLYLIIRGDKKH